MLFLQEKHHRFSSLRYLERVAGEIKRITVKAPTAKAREKSMETDAQGRVSKWAIQSEERKKNL